ncbi:unannotated protein [freshwater metagenome]|uniref:Unannotated protein n=1 Tax=freshwater metagenome TaxID=449393 RepID=A0A6J7NAE8_9ZZZZ
MGSKTSSSRCRARGRTTPSRARLRSCASTSANAGATRAISSWISSTVSRSKSVPSLSASSDAIRKSGIGLPTAAILRPTREMRPSRFVVVPAFSPQTVAGRKTSASAAASVIVALIQITKPAPPTPARTKRRSGKSLTMSAPTRISAPIRPSDAALKMPAVSSPASLGALPHAASKRSAPALSVTRPGRKPGARPRSIAPRTFPRRSAMRKRVFGMSRIIAAAATVGSADVATSERPRTTTMGPVRPSISGARAALISRAALACSPGR